MCRKSMQRKQWSALEPGRACASSLRPGLGSVDWMVVDEVVPTGAL